MTNVFIVMATDRFSGPARQVVQMFEHIDQEHYKLSLGCTLLEGSESTEFMQEVDRRGVRLNILAQKKPYDPTPIAAALKLVRREGIHIIQSHGYKSGVIAYFVSRMTGIPWIAFMHGHTTENLKMSWYYRLELLLAKRADRIVTVSEEMRSRLLKQGLPADRSLAIHNAIDPGQFQSATAPVNREEFGVAPKETLIGVIGRFSPEKGQDVFLEAMRVVTATHPVKVLLLGEGPTEQSLRELCAQYGLGETVIFAGYQPEIAPFYAILDLIVLPSRSEGLPNVAMEALFYKIPVVATAVGGTPEVIKDGETGLLVQPDAPEKLADAINRMLDDPTMASRFRSRGAEFISEEYSTKSRLRRIEGQYSDLMLGSNG